MQNKIKLLVAFGVIAVAAFVGFQNCSGYSNVPDIAAAVNGEDNAIQMVSLSGAYNVYGAVNSGVVPPSGGIDGHGYAYSIGLLGSSVAFDGTIFSIGASGTKNAVTNTKLNVATGKYASMRILGTSFNGAHTGETFVVTYSDGTSITFTQSLSDWGTPENYSGESIAKTMNGRITPTGATQKGTFNIYHYSFALDASKTVESVTLPASRDVVVFGINFTSPSVIVPPAAIKADYSHLKFNQTFSNLTTETLESSHTIDLTNSQTAGFNWYTTNPAWSPVTQQPNRFSIVTNGSFKALKIDGSGYGTSIFGGIDGTHGPVGNFFTGGAYYEARVAMQTPVPVDSMKPAPAHTNGSGNPWPCFWAVPTLEFRKNFQWPGAQTNYDNSVEIDIMELMTTKITGHTFPITGFSLHDWYGLQNVTCKGYCKVTDPAHPGHDFNVLTRDTTGSLEIASTTTPRFHTFGALIVPSIKQSNGTYSDGYVQYYFDDVPQVDPVTGFSTRIIQGGALPTTAATSHNFTPQFGDPWAYLPVQLQPYGMILETGGNAWLQVQYVRVWQK